ncbi:MAG: hypothetical protein HY062_16730 [Bacteroidetes bacterium]|nr:hypothetical protein [Bacteroidota bacterium]
MSIILKPQEYYYLYSPRRAVPEEMLKYTFESLVLGGHLQIYYKDIYINAQQKRKRPRLFVSLGNAYNSSNSYTHAETFVLSLFTPNEALRVHEIKEQVLLKLHNDLRKFRTEYVYKDVKAMGLIWLRLFLTVKGRAAKRAYNNAIETIENNTTALLKNPELLQKQLSVLGTGIVLAEAIALKRLNIKVPDLKEIAAIFEIVIMNRNTFSGRGLYGLGGSSSSSGGSDFGGYGGGAGGGAGSGGSW